MYQKTKFNLEFVPVDRSDSLFINNTVATISRTKSRGKWKKPILILGSYLNGRFAALSTRTGPVGI